MDKFSSHLYRIRKSTWGIIINLNIHVSRFSKEKKYVELLQVNDKLFIDFGNLHIMPKTSKKYFEHGVRWIRNHLNVNEPIVLTIISIDINPSDFQEEGIFFAMASWCSEYFDFEMPNYEYSFNKVDNKYEFIPDPKKLSS